MTDVKIKLRENAKKLFIEMGYKSTGILDITNATGISVGSFYQYYKSKELLFLELLMIESKTLKNGVISKIDYDKDAVSILKDIILQLFSGARSNPILSYWYDQEFFQKIQAKLMSSPEAEAYNTYSYLLFSEVLDELKSRGKIEKTIDNEKVIAMFNALSYVDLHREDVGQEFFPELISDMTTYIFEGLIRSSDIK